MGVTIKDIASLAGVTEGTVSRALRGDKRVANATKKRIRKIAESHGYVPNIAARELLQGETRLAGVVLTQLASSFLNSIVEGIIETLTSGDFDAVVVLTHDTSNEQAIVERLLRRRVKGFIVQPGVRREHLSVYERLHEAGTPVVMFDRTPEGAPCSCVVLADNAGGGRMAAERLMQLRRKKLAVLYDPAVSVPAVVRQRAESFLKAADGAAIAVPPRQKERLFRDGFDGVFVPSDLAALPVMTEARLHGVRIPEDLAVIGFDDLDFAPLLPVPLTTIRQPQREMGAAAARALLDLMAGKAVPERIVLPVSLVARESG